jgi:creatinine amidohydrolase
MIAILPIGSFEQHGPHLPLNTDNYQITAVAERVAEALGAFLLPTQPITTCYEHRGKKGSAVHFSANVFFRFLVGITERLYRQDFRKLAVLVGHGGIFITKPAVEHINYTFEGMHAMAAEYNAQYIPREMEHSGESETSRMLYHRPDLVRMERAVDFVPDAPQEYLTYAGLYAHSPTGVWGEPTKATAETGRVLFERTVRGMLAEIREVFG